MCNAKSYHSKQNAVFNGEELNDKSGINTLFKSGFEYDDWPILIDPSEGIIAAHWEFIAPWLKNWNEVKQSRSKFTTLNAVGERLLESRLYNEAARKRRCLVVVTGFYEWRHYKPEGAKTVAKYPYYITLRQNRPFFMAGVYQPWTDRETGETINTFATVTCAANELMAQVHNSKCRQPTILPEELAKKWLSRDLSDSEITQLAGYQIPASEMIAYPVRKDFRQIPDPLEPCEYLELPPIL
ncbi:MAG TPA: SOS response-associated peptidase [Parasegetibacter sp.]